MTTTEDYTLKIIEQAMQASNAIRSATTAEKNDALAAIKAQLIANKASILEANQKDLDAGIAKDLDSALMDRLELNDSRFQGMIDSLEQVIALPDPVGQIRDMSSLPSGIQVGKMRVPLGVIGIIYESRPNVTIEAASLCLKSGNAAILRGGSEAIHANTAIAACIKAGLQESGFADNAIQVIETTDRAAVGTMITAKDKVDVIIPRGGKGLIERISNEARVAVIKHLDGICHVYIDAFADDEKAIAIAINAKTQRYGTCNTMETLLVHNSKTDLLPTLAEAYTSKGVELRGCEKTQAVIDCNAATAEDWDTEYLAPILSIKVIDNLDDAIAHINQHGSHHTDSIVTENYSHSQTFLKQVDSSSVMINASTRFADGFEYGLGAEIGISTDKLHARGPVGLEGLTTEKYIVLGDGNIRQ